MIKDLVHLARNGAAQALIDRYYDHAWRRWEWNKFLATDNLVEAIKNMSLDHNAVAKYRVVDDRLFVVECLWKGRDIRFMTVFQNSADNIQVDTNPKISDRDYNVFQRVLINAITEALTPKFK